MIQSEKKIIKRGIKNLGYIFSFFLFSIIFFYIFKLTDKVPENWGYFSFLLIAISITLIGTILKMTLK